jgi:hypothetical protein
MSIRRTPWGGYQARLMIDGRQYTATLPTREEARDWERLVHARAITGMLPRRTTVRDYAAHWIVGYDTAPANTRTFHEVNLIRILEELGCQAPPGTRMGGGVFAIGREDGGAVMVSSALAGEQSLRLREDWSRDADRRRRPRPHRA